MSNELKPCPFCGGTDIGYTAPFCLISVMCNSCTAEGAQVGGLTVPKECETEGCYGHQCAECYDATLEIEAAHKWNTRVESPELANLRAIVAGYRAAVEEIRGHYLDYGYGVGFSTGWSKGIDQALEVLEKVEGTDENK